MESQLDLPRGLQGPCKSRRPQAATGREAEHKDRAPPHGTGPAEAVGAAPEGRCRWWNKS